MDRKRAIRALCLAAACLAATPAFAAATDVAATAAPTWAGLQMMAGVLGLYVAGCPARPEGP